MTHDNMYRTGKYELYDMDIIFYSDFIDFCKYKSLRNYLF